LPATTLLLSGLASQAQDVAFISLNRHAFYEQLADSEPQPAANEPFSLLAVMQMTGDFLADPDNLIFVRGVTLQPPSGNPQPMEFSEGYGGFALYAPFTTAPALENAFRAGNYRVTYGSFISGDTTYDLTVSDTALPAPARIVNFAATQNIDPTKGFTLRWTPPVPALGYAFLRIFDPQTGQEIHNSGAIPGEATEVEIPAGTLAGEPFYLARLSLHRLDLSDSSNQTLLSANTAANTQLLLRTGTGVVDPGPSRFTSITLNGSGDVVFTIECTPGVALSLQRAPALGAAWETVQTVTPDTSPVTLTLPSATLGQAAFFQGVQQ